MSRDHRFRRPGQKVSPATGGGSPTDLGELLIRLAAIHKELRSGNIVTLNGLDKAPQDVQTVGESADAYLKGKVGSSARLSDLNGTETVPKGHRRLREDYHLILKDALSVENPEKGYIEQQVTEKTSAIWNELVGDDTFAVKFLPILILKNKGSSKRRRADNRKEHEEQRSWFSIFSCRPHSSKQTTVSKGSYDETVSRVVLSRTSKSQTTAPLPRKARKPHERYPNTKQHRHIPRNTSPNGSLHDGVKRYLKEDSLSHTVQCDDKKPITHAASVNSSEIAPSGRSSPISFASKNTHNTASTMSRTSGANGSGAITTRSCRPSSIRRSRQLLNPKM
ncbi:hypothetical protein QFC24_006317 [Naganishia onofrii]|uniref:Uncharacterized protein n=1 Tax=Naganishia onofrii TaxID=1851511 RepID=A0ACC2X1W5_9TREE|nr:hypothetical protein QFC24_006317 [Naganishia onofrii]